MPPPQVSVSEHPLVRAKLTRLRDRRTSPRAFRALVGELATLLTYEATRELSVERAEVETPLTTASGVTLARSVGVVPILRAGLGMVEGVLAVLPEAQVWHLGMYRDERTLQPVEYYNKLPERPGLDTCLVLDPMLATGRSAAAAVHVLRARGVPRVVFLGLLAAPEGLDAFCAEHPDVPVHVAAVDERLTTADDGVPPGFIWPGLGDAGDRQFGTEAGGAAPA